MLEQTIRRYQNRAVEAAQVIEELIGLAREMREANARGGALGLLDDDLAFYDALGVNDSAVRVLGDETLRDIGPSHYREAVFPRAASKARRTSRAIASANRHGKALPHNFASTFQIRGFKNVVIWKGLQCSCLPQRYCAVLLWVAKAPLARGRAARRDSH